MQCPSCNIAIQGHPPFCPGCGKPLPNAAPPDPMVGRVLAGKFKILKMIGEGGMGAVYVGEQMLGTKARKVAIKTLHPHLSRDEKIRTRFQREVGTLASLEHPNTVQVFDFGQTPEDGVLFIAMEFVQGRSIGDILEKEGPLAPERVEKILGQICGSLAEAHAQGIIHRDLKPDNIILTERAGQKDFVKVLDFGIAKRSSDEDKNEAKLTQQGMVLGTPPYMSPEQFTGQPLDARSDIYSLSVMAYEMLTGKLPFDAASPYEWATLHMTAAPKAIEAAPNGAKLPESMRAAIMLALAKNKEQRFATITEFHERFAGRAKPSVGEIAASKATADHKSIPMVAAARQGTADMPGASPPPAGAASAPGVPAAAPYAAVAAAPPASPHVAPPAPVVAPEPALPAGAEQKGKTQIGEPLAFPAGGFGASPAPAPYGAPLAPPTANAPPQMQVAHAAPAYGSPQSYQTPGVSVPQRHSSGGGGGGNKGLIVGVIGVLGVLSVVLIAWGAGAFGSSSKTPAAPPPDLGGGPATPLTTTAAPTTPAPPPDTATGPAPPLGATPLTPPPPNVNPPPKPTTPPPKPTTPPTAPTTPPTTPPTPPPTTPPAPTPLPTPQPTTPPAPTPQPTPQPTTPPAPTPQPGGDPAICARARQAAARNSPAAPQLAAQCIAAGGRL